MIITRRIALRYRFEDGVIVLWRGSLSYTACQEPSMVLIRHGKVTTVSARKTSYRGAQDERLEYRFILGTIVGRRQTAQSHRLRETICELCKGEVNLLSSGGWRERL
ncbi:hypothetical protein RRG08_057814 [Elysia crispata]|uniref:Uncharacterized protein n=1 Tax=Elysia crispata TaxID=231223 RepID=A0AAE1AZ49_9GAST|nr:hypothetical protein RRG08_057814 [Elysia crispata]